MVQKQSLQTDGKYMQIRTFYFFYYFPGIYDNTQADCLCVRTYKGSFAVLAALRQLRQIRRSVSSTTFQMIVVRLVLCRLDNGVLGLVCISAYLLSVSTDYESLIFLDPPLLVA